MGKLFKRGAVWQTWIREKSGRWARKSTNCTDRRAAEFVAADLERGAADPTFHASRKATTKAVLESYYASRQRLGRTEGTLHHVHTKATALVTLLPSLASDITHACVERYIDARLEQNVRRTTIKKELRVLKASLKLARRNGTWIGEPADVIPELEDDYEPGTRTLSPWELIAVCGVITPRRMALVAFAAATGCDPGAIFRARREDVAPDCSTVRIRGTKNERRDRVVPLALPSQRVLVSWALEHADGGEDGVLFSPWSNMRRDLHIAAGKLGIPGFNATDLRRTFGTMLRNAGVEPQLIAPAMGHVDSRMVEKVYGRLTPEALGKLLDERVFRSQETALLMRDDQGDMGRGRGTGDDETAAKEPESCAQGRNRTADTGIFSPSIQNDGSPVKTSVVGDDVGVGALLMRCAPAPWLGEATANLYELRDRALAAGVASS